jgi:hypothetical protein
VIYFGDLFSFIHLPASYYSSTTKASYLAMVLERRAEEFEGVNKYFRGIKRIGPLGH